MAENITLSEASDIKNDVDEALRSDIEKQVDSSALFILPKLEDSPIRTFPSISVPCKFEPESQELGSMSITDQEVETALRSDNKKQVDISDPFLFPKLEDGSMITFHSILVPRKLEPESQEFGSTSTSDQGHFSPHVSGIHLQGNTSLFVSKNSSTSGFSNACAPESEGKGLGNQKTGLKSCLQNKKYRKLERYQRTHKKKKTYKCGVCDKLFSRMQHLNQHQRVYTGEKPFKCEVCEKFFSQNHSLNSHKRLHKGEKPFKCDICDKTFSQPSNLKTHKRMHMGEKPFKCDICDKTFSHSQNLKIHKRMHTGEKPFMCKVCDKTFSHSSHLNLHQRIHTGEKPFKCVVCKSCFSRKSSLNRHQQLHMG